MINNQDDGRRYTAEELYGAVYEAKKAVRIIMEDESDSLRELLRQCSPLALACTATVFHDVAKFLAEEAWPEDSQQPLSVLVDSAIKSMTVGITSAIMDTRGWK